MDQRPIFITPFTINCSVIIIILTLYTAWFCEDSFITLRYVEQIFAGNGVVWNTNQRVQGYTHPLWLGCLCLARTFSKNHFHNIVILSCLFSVTLYIFLTTKLNLNRQFQLILLCLLISSKAWMDYSTSGLENGFGHLSIAFYIIHVSCISNRSSKSDFFIFSILLCTLLLIRMDYFILIIPLFFHACRHMDNTPKVVLFTIGMLPLIAWLIFSKFYYGFFLPNTYYAKLHAGIENKFLLSEGIQYFINSITLDPLTLIIIFLSILRSIWGAIQIRLTAIGILLYLLYILSIGGDYMSGRFFSMPFTVAVIILLMSKPNKSFNRATILGLLCQLITVGQPSLNNITKIAHFDKRMMIEDSRAHYWDTNSYLPCFSGLFNSTCKQHKWIIVGKRLQPTAIYVLINIGMSGYNAPLTTYIIDPLGLTDAFLAHRRADKVLTPAIGHYYRLLPKGYFHAVKSGNYKYLDLNIQEEWKKFHLITSAPVWDMQRLKYIFALN